LDWLMIFNIQRDSPVPIYEQIVAQVTFAVAAGSLRPGDFIPSVRDLAADLVINPNTVARAFVELERRGLVEAHRGRGMAVTDEGVGLSRQQRLQIVRERIRAALQEVGFSGLTPAEIKQIIDEELTRAPREGQFRENQ
jgi:GntR family transcriptional regulator